MTAPEALGVRSAKRAEVPVMAELMQAYLTEFATFETVAQDADGRYIYPYFEHYWEDPNRYPFLFMDGAEPVGFALLRFEADPLTGQGVMELAEFFVVPARRRSGIGTAAAEKLWDLFPGQWRLSVLTSNRNAQPFWRRVVSEYTEGNYTEQAPTQAVGGAFTFTFASRIDADLPDDIDPELFDF